MGALALRRVLGTVHSLTPMAQPDLDARAERVRTG